MGSECSGRESLPDVAHGVGDQELATNDRINEPMRVATVMDHAPEAVKTTLCQVPLGPAKQCECSQDLAYCLGQVPNQVCPSYDNGGKGEKGKSKGKHNGKNKENLSPSPAQFHGCCSHGSKWGHKHSECRQHRAQQAKSGKAAGVSEPEVEATDAIKTVQLIQTEEENVDGEFVERVLCSTNSEVADEAWRNSAG